MKEEVNEGEFWSSALVSAFTVICLTCAAAVVGWSIVKRKVTTEVIKSDNKVVSKPKPGKWVQVGNVEKLIIYPIKSCPGVEVDEAVVTTLGLKFKDHKIRDRDFIVVDEEGKYISLRMYPTMALISVKLGGPNEITLEAPDMDPCTFSCPKGIPQEERLCRVGQDKGIRALDCGDKVAEWFQVYLDRSDLRVYYHHINETQRTFEPYMYKVAKFDLSDMGAFHNESSYHMISQESITELNKRLEKKSSWKNWRPNILINNVQEPFAEVNWSFVRLGNENGILKAAFPCLRCPLTTVDPDEGVLASDGEPLKTLKEMNRADYVDDKSLTDLVKNRGIMGLRLGHYVTAGEGAVVKVGQPVYTDLV